GYASRKLTSDWHALLRPASQQVRAKAEDCLGLQLRDARFVEIDDTGDFAQCEVLVIVEAQDGLFNFWNASEGIGEQAPELGAFEQMGRPMVFVVEEKAQEVGAIFGIGGFETCDHHAAR